LNVNFFKIKFLTNGGLLKLNLTTVFLMILTACSNSTNLSENDSLKEKIHLSKLKSEYLENLVRFESNYKNKIIYAVGSIYEIKKSKKDNGEIWIKIADSEAERLEEQYSDIKGQQAFKSYVICSTKDKKFASRLGKQELIYFSGIVSDYIEDENAVLIDDCELKAKLDNTDVVENDEHSNSSDLKLIFCGNTSGCAFSDDVSKESKIKKTYWIRWPQFSSVVADEKEKIEFQFDCVKKKVGLVNDSQSKLIKVKGRAENELLDYIARKQLTNYEDVENSNNQSDSYIKEDYDRFVALQCK
jgi:hypothetical protein